MTKPEWGEKRTCQACGARFYDMERSPILCPKCGAEFIPPVAVKTAVSQPVSVDVPKKVKPVAVDDDDIDLDDIDLDDIDLDDVVDDDDDDLMEDTSDLDDDDEDMSEVMEHMDPDDDI